jgi:titin
MITNGESYIYTNSTQVNFTISILTTSNVPIGSPSQTTTTTPSTFGSATPNTFTFTDGVFISTAIQVRIQANTGGIQVNFGTPTGGSFVNQDFCGFLQGYNLAYSQGTINVLPPSSSYTFTGLTNGTPYYFQVAAVNIYGTAGSYSAQNGNSNATPATTPGQVTGVTTSPGPLAGQISVSWNIPDSGGAPITYTLQYREVTIPPSSWTPIPSIPSNNYVITGLLNATTYQIEVKAVNAVGSGPYSNPAVLGVTFGLPGIPTGLTGAHGNTQVSLTWTAPANTGLTSLTGYVVEHSTSYSGPWTPNSTSSTSYIVTGLTNGTPYFFRVSAVNIVGTGSPSRPISVTPSTTPGPPDIISSVTCDNQQSLVTWAPPIDTGGALITSYNLQYSSTSSMGPWLPALPQPPPVSTITTSTIYNWLSLANGQSKTFVVNNAYSYQIGNNIKITYSNSDSITGTITGISGNNITITITSFTNASYTASTIYTSTSIDTIVYIVSLPNPIFTLNPAVSTPNPPIIPANSIITNGQSYIYAYSTFNFTISILTTSNVPIGSPSQATTTLTPLNANTFTFKDGVFITPAQEVRIQANTGGISVYFGTPIGGVSSVNHDFCGFLQGYTLGYSQGTIDILPITISYPFTGLTNGTQYYFQVQAVNFNGPGPYSAQTPLSTAKPSITPQPPIPITTTAVTSTSIAVSWTTPTGLANTGGNPVTGYIIYWSQVSPTGTIIPPINSYDTTTSGTPLATTYTIPGLTHATLYAIQISSVNCSGVGPISTPLYITTSSIPPSAPTNVLITNCNTGYTNSVILTWTAPADDGGSPITNYVIYYRTSSVGSSPAGTWYTYDTNSAATTATISFLSPSTSYDFKIAAQNAAGVGIFSSPIVSSSSYNPPTTPTNLVATNVVSNTSSNGSIVLTWNPSTQEGAQSISHYIIEYKICEFGGWITYPTIILSPTTSETLSNIGTSSNVANNVPYLFRVYAVNSCGAQSDRSNIDGATSYNNDEPTRLWSRFNLNCSGNITSIDNLNRDMLRKGQVLQYPVVGTLKFSRATLWSMAAKNQLTRKKAWASQSEEYTYPNTTNINNQPDVGLRQTPTSLVCWRQPPAVICNSSTASDVPGNPTTLCISKNAPFNNFRRPITYLAGGTKFPVIFSK